jgi:GNAT superfamily N-acetyltransferase
MEPFDAQTNKNIGCLEADDEGIVIGSNISPEYQRKGIATAVIEYLLNECGLEFYFWPPDGNRYNDARHLSEEGAS